MSRINREQAYLDEGFVANTQPDAGVVKACQGLVAAHPQWAMREPVPYGALSGAVESSLVYGERVAAITRVFRTEKQTHLGQDFARTLLAALDIHPPQASAATDHGRPLSRHEHKQRRRLAKQARAEQ
jgi:hypothetical protein